MIYLIAHLVRGKPAFDIAECYEDMGTPSDPAPWWIMPSTGHRVRPYWSIELFDLGENDTEGYVSVSAMCPEPPHDHPDFWDNDAQVLDDGSGRELLAKLGLLKPKEPVRRRV